MTRATNIRRKVGGRRGRHQQNILCECPSTSRPGAVTVPGPGPEGPSLSARRRSGKGPRAYRPEYYSLSPRPRARAPEHRTAQTQLGGPGSSEGLPPGRWARRRRKTP